MSVIELPKPASSQKAKRRARATASRAAAVSCMQGGNDCWRVIIGLPGLRPGNSQKVS